MPLWPQYPRSLLRSLRRISNGVIYSTHVHSATLAVTLGTVMIQQRQSSVCDTPGTLSFGLKGLRACRYHLKPCGGSNVEEEISANGILCDMLLTVLLWVFQESVLMLAIRSEVSFNTALHIHATRLLRQDCSVCSVCSFTPTAKLLISRRHRHL
jgi:hypothetical protein